MAYNLPIQRVAASRFYIFNTFKCINRASFITFTTDSFTWPLCCTEYSMCSWFKVIWWVFVDLRFGVTDDLSTCVSAFFFQLQCRFLFTTWYSDSSHGVQTSTQAPGNLLFRCSIYLIYDFLCVGVCYFHPNLLTVLPAKCTLTILLPRIMLHKTVFMAQRYLATMIRENQGFHLYYVGDAHILLFMCYGVVSDNIFCVVCDNIFCVGTPWHGTIRLIWLMSSNSGFYVFIYT